MCPGHENNHERPYETPAQSAVAAVLGGLGGGCLDLGAHLLRQDEQFRAAVSWVRA
jgi:hypothetical protein